jgi:hypothetical protein
MTPVTKCGELFSLRLNDPCRPCILRAGHPGLHRAARGFAGMDPEKRRAICSAGGKASHAKGVGHEWTSDEARIAGKLGGMASQRKST